ncbi:MAG TPA: hypothetical protein DDY20_13075 [Desulfobulbaceae bacterium]|nr:hypothetical protein [Desulfobulbaceae bacterium]
MYQVNGGSILFSWITYYMMVLGDCQIVGQIRSRRVPASSALATLQAGIEAPFRCPLRFADLAARRADGMPVRAASFGRHSFISGKVQPERECGIFFSLARESEALTKEMILTWTRMAL